MGTQLNGFVFGMEANLDGKGAVEESQQHYDAKDETKVVWWCSSPPKKEPV